MMNHEIYPKVLLPEGFDTYWEDELPVKGYIDDVVVGLEGGAEYTLNFIDPTRLRQELDLEVGSGRPFYATPNLVVLPEVTKAAIQQAVPRLLLEGYFESLKPSSDRVPHPFHLIQRAQAVFASAKGLPPEEAKRRLSQASGLYEDALGLNRAIEKNGCLLHGNCQESLGNDERALESYNRVLEIDPHNDMALTSRGLLTYQSDRENAVKDLSRAIDLGSDLVWPYYYLAHDAFERRELQEGLRLSDKALKLTDRGDVLRDLGEWIAWARSKEGADSPSLGSNGVQGARDRQDREGGPYSYSISPRDASLLLQSA